MHGGINSVVQKAMIKEYFWFDLARGRLLYCHLKSVSGADHCKTQGYGIGGVGAKVLGEMDVARMVRSDCRRLQASTVDDRDAPL